MLRIILVLAALVCFGCESGSSTSANPTTLSPGVYQARLDFIGQNSGDYYTLESNFGSDGTYIGKAFFSDGTRVCQIVDGTGRWKGGDGAYLISGASVKTRDNCTTDYDPAESIPDESTQIRKVTSDSFEEYFEMDGQPAQWLYFGKI